MKKLLFIFTLFICFNNLDAQFLKAQKDMSEIRLNKNHLELDIKNIFSGLSGASLIYKRRLESAKYVKVNSLNLLRVFATFNYKIDVTGKDQINQVPVLGYFVDDFTEDYYSNKLGFGLEWQKTLKGFVHYIGSDLILGYDRNVGSIFSYYTQNGQIVKQVKTSKTIDQYSAGVNPFFGIKYYFNSNLNIGIETGVYLAFQNTRVSSKIVTTETLSGNLETTNEEFPKQKFSSILTSFNGLRFLTVGYCF